MESWRPLTVGFGNRFLRRAAQDRHVEHCMWPAEPLVLNGPATSTSPGSREKCRTSHPALDTAFWPDLAWGTFTLQLKTHCLEQDVSTSALMWGLGHSLWWGAFLWLVGCLAAPLTSDHPFSSCGNQACFQTLPDVPWGPGGHCPGREPLL